jgi:hypothetical protein
MVYREQLVGRARTYFGGWMQVANSTSRGSQGPGLSYVRVEGEMNPTDLEAVKRALFKWLQSDFDLRRMVFEAVKDEAKLEEDRGGPKSPFTPTRRS